MPASYPSAFPEPDRPEIAQALRSLAQVTEFPLHVRYAQMWLREAAGADNAHDEARHLINAEHQLARALLASATPTLELVRAFELTMEARREAAH